MTSSKPYADDIFFYKWTVSLFNYLETTDEYNNTETNVENNYFANVATAPHYKNMPIQIYRI